MSTLLVFPPQWTPVSPYSALPLLRARLQADGMPVAVLDLNCMAYDAMLSEEYFSNLRVPASFAPQDPRHRFAWLLASRAQLAGLVDEAKRVLRDPSSFYDSRRYLWAENVLRYGLFLVSLSFWPQQVSLDSVDLGLASGDMFAPEALDRPFGTFVFEDALGPILEAGALGRHALVAFSVHTKFQLFYTLRIVRRCFGDAHGPRPHIVIGGSLLSSLHRHHHAFAPLWRAGVHSVVYASGAEALSRLSRAVAERRSVSSCPGLIAFADGATLKTPPSDGRQNQPALLDYADLPLGEYLSPTLIANIPASSGCYWGKCRFCNYRERYSVLEPEHLSRLMEKVGATHGTRRFFLAQSALHYDQVEQLPMFPTYRPGHTWGSLARIDDRATLTSVPRLHAAGCRKLSLGLETASPALRAKMNKGPLAPRFEGFIERCQEQGLGIELMFVAGYPGETMRDVQRTLRFIERFLPCIDTFSANTFSLVCNAHSYSSMLEDDRFVVSAPRDLSFSQLVDQRIAWQYRDARRQSAYDQRLEFFWQAVVEIVHASPSHVWRDNTATRVGFPRLPEHHYLYCAERDRVTGAESLAAIGERLVPADVGGQRIWADPETFTVATHADEA